MKFVSVVGICLLTAAMVYGEWRSRAQKKARIVAGGITLLSAMLALTLLFLPNLPGPTQWIKLLFGKVDKFMK
ncbi:hypothetical protein [Paenibacillus tundrae]|uniref:Uncharacterized protein n=1 Tax=Paenibacillus tundrae TaxID=528187 RepID=A0ABT9WEY9_9BACL|nr:hypothetical protein [Paenibacillus tundrae]MDQ0171557.1 hypothetical protein [Paenibacillus tundrae]